MKITRYLPLLLCLCISQALADTPIQLRHDASATARISISNVAGSVNVIAWDRNEVQVSGRLGDGTKPLAITGSNDHLEIKVEAQGSSHWLNWGSNSRMGPTTLELHVPKAASLEVDVVSAPLVIDGMDGGAIEVNTVSGRARINARTPSLSVDSVSGGIEQAGQADKANLQSVSGDILAPALGSQVELQTVSGRIQASGGPWQKLTLSTVSGNVQLNGGLTAGGSIDVDSMSGDVQLQLPANSNARLHASSFSGNLHSDFGTPTEPEHGPGSSLDTQLGKGQGKIGIETFSGDLRIRKQD
ncbi:DUF4097 family beta strand repeat-containing protein [Rhodanobacter sp. AS-Z3]|uniref:DUF4097 family beta strand repeat-containing protein n=1 Tax=Rhodanobacter sp. AS-Z3 TaxID=3031330 RepID=UPI00247A8379|nr:DUF4097 family beta strand repeat-containing protein [Rhodanobacter sp. AS-Z3]WEN14915.1 DUF4097 family beta strand repeat-containing protein [Rhodanobacter sp. AS-Z3]